MITITPRPELRASELSHQVTQAIAPCLAMLIINELGDAQVRGSLVSSWYGAVTVPIVGGDDIEMPIALRMDAQGQASIAFRFDQADMVAHAINGLVPLMAEVVEPKVSRKRYH